MVCLHGLFIVPLHILCGGTVNMSYQCSYFVSIFSCLGGRSYGLMTSFCVRHAPLVLISEKLMMIYFYNLAHMYLKSLRLCTSHCYVIGLF